MIGEINRLKWKSHKNFSYAARSNTASAGLDVGQVP